MSSMTLLKAPSVAIAVLIIGFAISEIVICKKEIDGGVCGCDPE